MHNVRKNKKDGEIKMLKIEELTRNLTERRERKEKEKNKWKTGKNESKIKEENWWKKGKEFYVCPKIVFRIASSFRFSISYGTEVDDCEWVKQSWELKKE